MCVLNQSVRHAIARQQAEKSTEATHPVEASIRAYDDFLAALGDELRTPLTSVLSALSSLMTECTTPTEILPTLAMIKGQAERQGRVIDGIQEYSRVGTQAATMQRIDCDAVVERALTDLMPAIDESCAVITHDPLPTVWADIAQMGQLFQKLICNAINYGGAASPRIHVAAERQGDLWFFNIRDNGIGFDPNQAEKIFTIFQRLHDGDEHPGIDIGLAICKKIVERHSGRIWAESEPGQGSRFFFTIPASVHDKP